MSKFTELRKRVEGASPRDQRELLIAAYDLLIGEGDELAGRFFDFINVGAFVDAAFALVETLLSSHHPHMTIRSNAVRGGSQGWFYFEEITVPSSEFQGRSRHRPLAILSALLRALDQQDPTHGG